MHQTGSLLSVLARIRRRWTVFAAVFAAFILTTSIVYSLITPKYTAHAAIVVHRGDVAASGTAPALLPNSTVGDASDIESQIAIVHSPHLAQMILDRPEVKNALKSACEYSAAQPISRFIRSFSELFGESSLPCSEDSGTAAVESIRTGVVAAAAGSSRVIDVSYSAPLPATAATVVNALVEAYLADNATAKSEPRWQTALWLEREIAELRDTLTRKEVEIDQYQQSHDLLQGQVALVTREQLSVLIGQLGQAQSHLAQANARLMQIREAQQSGKLDSIPDVITSPMIKSLREQEASMDGRIASLTSHFGPLYPTVREAQAQRLKIDSAINAEIGRIAESLEREIADASGQVQQLQSYYQKAKRDASAANAADSRLQSLLRDADVERQLYTSLAIHAKQLETETRAERPDARLVNLAELPYKPSFPRPLSYLAASLLLACTLGGVSAFLRDRMDRTVRVPADVLPSESSVMFLGKVPFERGLRAGGQSFIEAIGRDPSPIREAIRSIYARLRLGSQAKMLLVTSSAPKEGKSSLALALAHHASSVNQRVLLIEADMRKPVIGRLLELPADRHGLYHVLNGEIHPGDAIERLSEFDLLRAGAVTANSTELLSSERLNNLLNEAAPHYDLVIIDTPPCEYLMDACMLARRVDYIIYTVCWGGSPPDVVRAGLQSLSGVAAVGVVLNMVDVRRYATYDTSASSANYAYIAG